MKKYLLFIPILTLIACSSNSPDLTEEIVTDLNQQVESSATTLNEDQFFTSQKIADDYEKSFKHATSMQFFFKEDQSTAYFKGVGNEYASYTEKTTWLSNDYVRIDKDNTATITTQYFKIMTDAIYLIKEVIDEQVKLTVQDLQEIEPVSALLNTPLRKNVQFDNWTILNTHETVVTPYDTFQNVIVLYKENDNTSETKYYARGYGIIKTIFTITPADSEEYIVQSELTNITFQK